MIQKGYVPGRLNWLLAFNGNCKTTLMFKQINKSNVLELK
jgi:hypothetical protein